MLGILVVLQEIFLFKAFIHRTRISIDNMSVKCKVLVRFLYGGDAIFF